MATKKSVMRIAYIIFPAFIVLAIIILYFDWLDLFGRFISYLLLISLFIFGSVLISLFGPQKFDYKIEDWQIPENQYIPDGYDKSKWNILLDTHFHTYYSDGVLNIEEAINWHIALGFNAFFVTDHNNIDHWDELERIKDKYKDKILVMHGIEVDNDLCHFNVLGLKEWKPAKLKFTNSEEQIKAIIDYAHKQGAVVTINHYPWSTGGEKPRFEPKKHPTREQAYEWGFDFIEASNWDDDINTIDMVSYDFCKERENIAPVAGTDVHLPYKDKLWGWTLLNVPEFTEDALMKELREHKTDVLFKKNGIPYPTLHTENSKYFLVRPLAQIGDMFLSIHKNGAISNLAWKNVIIWIFYFIVLFIIIELLAAL